MCDYCNKANKVKEFIDSNLQTKYTTSIEFFNVKVVNDIMYNEKV